MRQGDIFWLDLGDPVGSEPAYRRPFVVIQNDVFNQSRIHTVILCAITTNMKRAEAPGNILLEVGEGGLQQQSVVLVSQVFTVDKSQVEEYIGSLSQRRVHQILDGILLVLEPRSVD
jgi:mRNA interferase MazF